MAVRGIRGATCVPADHVTEIIVAVKELLIEIQKANPGLKPADLASVVFTVTEDLHSAFPARAARDLGWTDVPLLDVKEMAVGGSLPHCIRVLLLWNTRLPQEKVQHVYLREAAALRPDLIRKN
jgi:chorismate mutase